MSGYPRPGVPTPRRAVPAGLGELVVHGVPRCDPTARHASDPSAIVGEGDVCRPFPLPPAQSTAPSPSTHPGTDASRDVCLAGTRADATWAVHAATRRARPTSFHGDRLDAWLDAVEADTLIPLHRFANGLRRDYDAVRAGLTLEHNSGRVEGTVNKIK